MAVEFPNLSDEQLLRRLFQGPKRFVGQQYEDGLAQGEQKHVQIESNLDNSYTKNEDLWTVKLMIQNKADEGSGKKIAVQKDGWTEGLELSPQQVIKFEEAHIVDDHFEVESLDSSGEFLAVFYG